MKRIGCLSLLIVLCIAFLTIASVSAASPLSPASASPRPFMIKSFASSTTGGIAQVDPASVSADICLDPAAIKLANYDGILSSDGLSFAERFNGQSLTTNGDFDVLSGSPANPLALQVGLPNQNIVVNKESKTYIAGLGHLGYPEFNAIGEGSIAVLYPAPQAAIKLDVYGSDSGPMTANFFKDDGTLIGTSIIDPLTDGTYAFKTTSGNAEISGISVTNTDPAGIGYSGFCYSKGPAIPEFPSMFVPLLMIISMLGILLLVKGRKE